MENTEESKMSKNLISYLNLISSNSSFIPPSFFTLYELNRIDFEDDVLM